MSMPRLITLLLLSAVSMSCYSTDKVSPVCKELRHALDTPAERNKLDVESQVTDGGTSSYPSLDLDGDGIKDKVVRSCGGGGVSCDLFVEMSRGKRLQLVDQPPFFLGRFKEKVYVISGDSRTKPQAEKKGKRSIYEITPAEIKLVCDKL